MSQHQRSEYDEDQIVLAHLGHIRNGLVVEVGASDGERDSNSFRMVHKYGWRAILIEPSLFFIQRLRSLYAGNPNVVIMHNLIAPTSGTMAFWTYGVDNEGVVSTACEKWRERVCREHGNQYSPKPLMMKAVSLADALREVNCPDHIDLLSLDCEGLDADIARSFPMREYNVGVACLEHGWGHENVDLAMAAHDYVVLRRTIGNSLYVPKGQA